MSGATEAGVPPRVTKLYIILCGCSLIQSIYKHLQDWIDLFVIQYLEQGHDTSAPPGCLLDIEVPSPKSPGFTLKFTKVSEFLIKIKLTK